MTDVAQSWRRIERWFERVGVEPQLNPPASGDAVRSLEETLGRALPESYLASLRVHDGQPRHAGVRWLGGGLASLADLRAEYERHYAREEADELFDLFSVDGVVRASIFHPGRLPITGVPFFDGDNTYLDFIPGPKGVEGQVIKLISECDFVVLGSTWGEVLDWYAGAAERGDLEWDAESRRVRLPFS